jgi:septal ring factor EnvC (AmiA/AmiB activator)
MHTDTPRSPPQPGRQRTHTSSPANGVGYREALVRIRAVRAEERDQIADERDQIADERDQVADRRDQVADERERLADHREQQLNALPGNRSGNQADPSSQESYRHARAAARTARNRARASREKTAAQRTEAAWQRETAAAPYWPSQLDSSTTRAEFLAIRQRTRDTIARSHAAVQIARALCESARESSQGSMGSA